MTDQQPISTASAPKQYDCYWSRRALSAEKELARITMSNAIESAKAESAKLEREFRNRVLLVAFIGLVILIVSIATLLCHKNNQ